MSGTLWPEAEAILLLQSRQLLSYGLLFKNYDWIRVWHFLATNCTIIVSKLGVKKIFPTIQLQIPFYLKKKKDDRGICPRRRVRRYMWLQNRGQLSPGSKRQNWKRKLESGTKGPYVSSGENWSLSCGRRGTASWQIGEWNDISLRHTK